MRKSIVIGIAGVLVLAGLAAGSWYLYQNHLSSDLRRELTAVLDPNASETDARTYLRDARVMVRTKKDRQLFDKLQRVFRLYDDIQSDNTLINTNLTHPMMHIADVSCAKLTNDAITYSRIRSDVVKKLLADDKHECDMDRNMSHLESEQTETTLEWKKQNIAEANKLIDELRSNLGLPALSNTDATQTSLLSNKR